jgi:outer membrane protein assembly factor BamB
MRQFILRSWIACATLAALLPLRPGDSVRGDEWPQWLGPRRDSVWRETGIVRKFPEGGPQVVWRTPIKAGYTGPAVAEGRVYVMDRVLAPGAKNHPEPFPTRPAASIPGVERVLCLDASNGKLLWAHEYDCPYTMSYPLGPRATPAVGDGKVYSLGAEGNLFCLDARSGKALWSHDFKKEYGARTPLWGYSGHPLLDGRRLVCMVGGEGSAVVAFDKDTGKEVWRALTAKELGYAPPMIYELGGKRQLVVWHGEAAAGLDPKTGKLLWSQKVNSYMGMAIATPRQWHDVVFFTAYPRTALAVRPGAGAAPEVVWGNDRDKGLFSVFSAPFIDDGVIYGTSTAGVLTAVKAATGERLWESVKPLGEKTASGELFLVKNGDQFFITTEKGDLVIARLTPKGYEEVSRAHLLEPTSTAWNRPVVWSHPAFANRRAYLRNDKEIVCAALAAKE